LVIPKVLTCPKLLPHSTRTTDTLVEVTANQ
jgi:hypothetical protein